VGNASGEVPEVVFFYIGDKTFSVVVYGGDAGAAVEHESPFGGGVPVQFANATGSEAHVYASQGFGDGEFAQGDLAGPAAAVQALVAEAEKAKGVIEFAPQVGDFVGSGEP